MSTEDDEGGSDRTIQMSPDALAKLHAELAGKRKAAVSPVAETVLRETTVEVEHADILPPARVAPKPPGRPAAPVAPPKASEAPAAGGGALVLGGIGALIAALGPGLLTLTNVNGVDGDLREMSVYGGLGALVLGHLLASFGMFSAVSRTNGLAALVGVFHLLATLAVTLLGLLMFRVVRLDGDLMPVVMVSTVAVVGCTWVLSGIWGFSATGRLGAMGILHGIFGLLGGAAIVTLGVGSLAELFRRADDDLAILLMFGGACSVLLGAIFLAIGQFGRLRAPA